MGGVAGGMSAATRLRRLDEEASIIVLERSGHVSYANCGLPYFVGGVIEDEDDLLLQTPERLFDRFRLDVRVGSEVVGHRPGARTRWRCGRPEDGATTELPYDALVLSPGAAPVRPPLPGFDRVRVCEPSRTPSCWRTRPDERPRTAVVIGAGFVGLETAENLAGLGIADHGRRGRRPGTDAARPRDGRARRRGTGRTRRGGRDGRRGGRGDRERRGARRRTGRSRATSWSPPSACGPTHAWPQMAGLALGPHGGIAVDADGRTSAPDVYAVGDAVEKSDSVGGGSSLIALANIANRQGRRVADAICGRDVRPAPSQGTAIVKVFAVTAAMTGWNERRLRAEGRTYRVIHSHPMSHAAITRGPSRCRSSCCSTPKTGPSWVRRRSAGRGSTSGSTSGHGHGGGPSGRRVGRPRACLCATVLLCQGPRQHAGLHGREPDVRRVRRASSPTSSPVSSSQAGRSSTCGRSDEHAAGAIPDSRNVPLDALRGVSAHSAPGPSSSTARSASAAIRRRCCSTSWGSPPATSTVDTGPGGRPTQQQRVIPIGWCGRRSLSEATGSPGSAPGSQCPVSSRRRGRGLRDLARRADELGRELDRLHCAGRGRLQRGPDDDQDDAQPEQVVPAQHEDPQPAQHVGR